jgi:hypothetical protein
MEPNIDFIRTYFTQEKIESFFFIIIGLISIASALIFWFIIKYSFYNGLAYPLLIIGIIQLVVGTTVYIRSQKDITRVELIVKNEPFKIKTDELPRMDVVMKNFKTHKIIEIVLLLIGLSLVILFFNSSQTFWKGLGSGLLIQAALMLILDLLAEDRATKFIDELSKISL